MGGIDKIIQWFYALRKVNVQKKSFAYLLKEDRVELAHQLERREVDFCIISKRGGDHGWIPLCQDPLMAMVPASHPLAQAESVPLASFETEPFIEMFSGIETDDANVFARRPSVFWSLPDPISRNWHELLTFGNHWRIIDICRKHRR